MTVDEAIKKASKYFKEGGIESPDSNILSSLAMLFIMEETEELIRVISSHLGLQDTPLSSPSEGE